MTGHRDADGVTNHRSDERFEFVDAGSLAYLTYTEMEGTLYLLHTDVPDSLGGRGVGGRLLRAALEYARQRHLLVVAFCPFAKSYIQRHPEYHALVRPE